MKKNLMKSTFSGKRSNANVSIASQSSYGGHRQSTLRGSKSTLYASNSRKNVAIDEKSQKGTTTKSSVQVFDDHGQDITPRSLLQGDFSSQRKNQSGAIVGGDSSSVGTPSDFMSQSIYGASMQTSYAQGFTRSMMGSVMGASSRISLDSITDEITEPSHTQDFSAGLADIQTRRAYVKEELTEEELDKMISVDLSETDTIWLLDLPGTSVAKDNEDHEKVLLQNQKYEELLKNRVGNDMYIERGMQTYNNAPKHKELQTSAVGKQEVGCMATTWDMYDTYSKDEAKVEGKTSDDLMESLSRPSSPTGNGETETLPTVVETGDISMTSLRKSSSIQSLMTESRASFMTSSSPSEMGDTTDRESAGQINIDLQADKILKLESFKKNLFTIERAVVQNTFHPKQATYRGFTPVSDSTKEGGEIDKEEIGMKLGSNLARLWAYSCSLTKGKKVNCMAWNKVNNHLLAVGYGNFGSLEHEEGLVCCWSLKNPEYPERLYRLHTAVTSIDFSTAFPNLLAVGLYDGTIAIINVRHTEESPVLDSSDSQGKQSGPIWQLRWIDRNKGTGEDKGGEILVSSSADGRITQWSIRKGFEYQDLMKLKKMNISKQVGKSPTKGDNSKKGDALISRYVAAMCFDFHPNDGNLYLAGTEEGNIHKCSCSYNEQFLETYSGHTGAVYKLMWCPLLPDAFISCSADWSIRLWHQEKQTPVLTLQSAQEALNDIDWSPHSPTVIGAVNNKQIEIWDLSHSTLDPLIINVSIDSNVQLTSIIFSLDSEIVLIGDSEGQLTVYQLRAMPPVSPHQVGILSKIIHSLDDGKTEIEDEINKNDTIDR